jgi:hypothetical protein
MGVRCHCSLSGDDVDGVRHVSEQSFVAQHVATHLMRNEQQIEQVVFVPL